MHGCGRVRVVSVVCVIAMTCSLVMGKYGGGNGTAADPYLIYTAEHLKAIADDHANWGYYTQYKLMADIDLAGVAMQPLGTDAERFVGIFDGNGKTISNLKIEVSSGNNVGLFGCAEVEVYNLGLINVSINAPQSTSVGALAGWVARKIEGCYVQGGTVAGLKEVGGLVGTSYGSVTRCFATCQVSGNEKVGGLIGWHVEHQTVNQCYASALVSGTQDVGGLVGVNRGVLRDCYATSEVRGSFSVGGLIGSSGGKGSMWNCYAAGLTSATGSAGGLSGRAVTHYSCYWDMETTGQASSPAGIGKMTVQMRLAETFRGWGRSGAWTINEGADYPRLAWQRKPGVPLTTTAFPGNEGDGTAMKPYLIHTAHDLAAIGDLPNEWDKHYRLTADIDLARLEGVFRIMGSDQVYFTGTFDGDGHSISNFQCPYAHYGVGMFAYTRGAVIRRLTLINPRTEMDWSISVGTLVGQQVEGTVEACGAEGGFASGSSFVGGLIGRCCRGTVTRCYSTCTVQARNTAEDAGGLVGKGERCNVNNSYASGAVDGLRYVGGLIGRMIDMGSVTHCYSVGRVTGLQDVGGLIGSIDQPFVKGCFWDSQASGLATSAVGDGLLTVDMQRAATFALAGWDLWGETTNGVAEIWSVAEGKGYPQFNKAPIVPPAHAWADNFEDGDPLPLWRVSQPKPNVIRVREINGRLEVDTPAPEDSGTALYVAAGWMVDGTKDFSLKADFRFDANGVSEGWVSIGLTPSSISPTSQYVELTAGHLDGRLLYTGEQAAGTGKQKWWAARGCDAGTLYISYDAAKDELYRSFTGYGPINAWHVATGLLKETWAGKPLYVIIGGGSAGLRLKPTDAWLDDFTVDTGTVVP